MFCSFIIIVNTFNGFHKIRGLEEVMPFRGGGLEEVTYRGGSLENMTVDDRGSWERGIKSPNFG